MIRRNVKSNWPLLLNGAPAWKARTLFGGIQHNSAALRFELDIGESARPLPGNTTLFRLHACSRLPWFSAFPRYSTPKRIRPLTRMDFAQTRSFDDAIPYLRPERGSF